MYFQRVIVAQVEVLENDHVNPILRRRAVVKFPQTSPRVPVHFSTRMTTCSGKPGISNRRKSIISKAIDQLILIDKIG